jgi:adenosylcobinamide-phosphate synthase
MAGALGITLLGPRVYEGRVADAPYLNAEGRPAEPDDIGRALAVFRAACGILLALVTIAGVAVLVFT